MDAERVHDVGAVSSHGVRAQIELGRNFFVRLAVQMSCKISISRWVKP